MGRLRRLGIFSGPRGVSQGRGIRRVPWVLTLLTTPPAGSGSSRIIRTKTGEFLLIAFLYSHLLNQLLYYLDLITLINYTEILWLFIGLFGLSLSFFFILLNSWLILEQVQKSGLSMPVITTYLHNIDKINNDLILGNKTPNNPPNKKSPLER